MPVAEAKPICHTEIIKITFCPQGENSLQQPLLACRFKSRRVNVCREVEPVRGDFFDWANYLELHKGKVLRDETIFVETAKFRKIETDTSFEEVRLNKADLQKLELQQQKIDAVEKPIREMKK